MLLVCTGLSDRRGVVLMVPDNSAIFSSASTNFFCVAFSSAVKLALVAVSLAVVAQSAAVAVARFAIAWISSSNAWLVMAALAVVVRDLALLRWVFLQSMYASVKCFLKLGQSLRRGGDRLRHSLHSL